MIGLLRPPPPLGFFFFSSRVDHPSRTRSCSMDASARPYYFCRHHRPPNLGPFSLPSPRCCHCHQSAVTPIYGSTYYSIHMARSRMAVTIKLMSLIVATLGLLSFIFGVIAENKKPAAGTAINMKDVTVCKYNSDPTVALGSLSFAFLIACSVAGFTSVFYPYKGRPVSQSILFQNKSFLVFFLIALGLAGLGGAFLLWPTIVEQLHIDNNVHPLESTSCPTAKTGLLGGAAFLSLDSMLMWLVTLMLVSNTREDYFDEVEGSGKGDGPEVLPGDYDTAGHMKAVA